MRTFLTFAISLIKKCFVSFLFLYLIYPVKFLHPISILSSNFTNSLLNIRSLIAFCMALLFFVILLKTKKEKQKIYCKAFVAYVGGLFLMLLYSYFKGVVMGSEIHYFLLCFLPVSYFALFIKEENFMQINKIIYWGLIVFFVIWHQNGCFWVKDYLGFYTLILFAILHTLTQNLKIFYILYLLFCFYLWKLLPISLNGIGQIGVIYFCCICFCIYKKQYKKLIFCLLVILLGLSLNQNYEKIYNVFCRKANTRKELLLNNETIKINKNLLDRILLISPYRSYCYITNCYYTYPHNTWCESYMVYGILGFIWYWIVNILCFLGLKKTNNKYFFLVMFLGLSLLSLKQGSILSQPLLILLHVFGLKMFFIKDSNNLC